MDFLRAEEAARLASESPDGEIEGTGDDTDWRQPGGKGDANT